jgi:8-oxo-dGTP pyrophosphatase MutT (NUDIX family)
MESPWYRVSIKVIAVNEEGKFLLTKEENGLWEMLGGGLDWGEKPTEGIQRELQEEAGLTATWIAETPSYFITSPRYNPETGENREGYSANVIYEVKLEHLDITPSEECVELGFFTAEEALALPAFPNVKELARVFNPALHQK